jgi:histidinol phosphatase-like enzyme
VSPFVSVLERKNIDIDGFVYIGKEANDIDEKELDVCRPQVFLNNQDIMNKIMQLNP